MSRPRSPFRRSETAYPHLAHVASLKPSRMRLGLENIAAAFARLGDPHRRYPAILVAGTNGKGSVTAYCSAMLRAAGFAVGTFYSPHIFRIHERIRCGGFEISSRALDDALRRVSEAARGVPLTYFERLTAAAAVHFAERGVDIAVFEVGLGGRLDATNLVDAAVTVITGISHDHREHLGRTSRRILAEKLGILRPGVPLVALLPTAALERQARAAAEAVGAPVCSVRDEARARITSFGPEGMTVNVAIGGRAYGRLAARMIGRRQADNIATAVCAIESLGGALAARARGAGTRRAAAGLRRSASRHAASIGDRAVRAGIGAAFLPGRFQVVRREPLVVLDVSHNEESFVAALRTFVEVAPDRPRVIVFGMLAHKELGRFPERAVSASDTIVVTRLADRRAAAAGTLAAAFRAVGRGPIRAEIIEARGMRAAIRAARRAAGAAGAVLIMGSHMAVEEAAPYI